MTKNDIFFNFPKKSIGNGKCTKGRIDKAKRKLLFPYCDMSFLEVVSDAIICNLLAPFKKIKIEHKNVFMTLKDKGKDDKF